MKVKVGDNVRIIAGKDKGKEGKVIRTLKKKDQVVEHYDSDTIMGMVNKVNHLVAIVD